MAGRFARLVRIALCWGGLMILCAGEAFAFMPPTADESPIAAIRVIGTERLEPETVVSYLTLNKGDTVTAAKMNKALKTLYGTGLFADITIEMEGDTLVVQVRENPILSRVEFEGNSAISTEDLEKEVKLKARMVYTLPRVERDVQRILDVYRRSGRFGAVVEPKIVKKEQNRIDLVFEVVEGDRTGIQSISFVGNKAFSEGALREAISTSESAWWRFFSTSDYYDPDRLNYDKELLRQFYLNEGYVDFRVLSAVAELTPDRRDFFVTFSVEEGPRYKFGKISVNSEIKGLESDELKPYLLTEEGSWYSANAVEKSVAKLMAALGDRQYAFAVVFPKMERHKDDKTVDLTYVIQQGARVYVDRIDISGNTNTVDKVIRREMQLAEGDPFSTSALAKSEQRIKDLGFFSEVSAKAADGAQPDRADIKIKVKEKSTGEAMIGAGYSSTDGPLGSFSISQRNFMGRGQDLRFGATISGRTKQLDTSFTEPYFLDYDVSAGIDLFATQTDNQDSSSYDFNTAGATLRLGYPLSDEIRQKLNYSLHVDEITDVPSTASLYVKDQEGVATTSSFGQSLIYDTRDSKLTPTLGFLVHVDTDIAGAGGSRKWVRAKVGGTQFYPLSEEWIASGTLEVGQIWSLDGATKLNERFFLGGDNLRGFQYAGIGARDVSSADQDALGGTRFMRGSASVSMPLPVSPEFGFKGHLFTDFGVLGKPDSTAIAGTTIREDESLRLSLGFGLTWDSPLGPIRLDFAAPILYKSYDKIQNIHFSFGTRF
ncbi:MAG: outer membrane protein assembly factor BamA [Alphaproteobacteria bacterium]|nr:outer membrane protein assembly factor BamA [Alphaproteobacteria bacterium]